MQRMRAAMLGWRSRFKHTGARANQAPSMFSGWAVLTKGQEGVRLPSVTYIPASEFANEMIAVMAEIDTSNVQKTDWQLTQLARVCYASSCHAQARSCEVFV